MTTSYRRMVAREAAYLRSEGLLLREIAKEMGFGVSYVGELLRDPSGEDVDSRRDKMRGACADCGKPTAWGDLNGPAVRCVACYKDRRHRLAQGHGTHSRYSRGCRCDACTAGNTAYHRERRERLRAEQDEHDQIEGARLGA